MGTGAWVIPGGFFWRFYPGRRVFLLFRTAKPKKPDIPAVIPAKAGKAGIQTGDDGPQRMPYDRKSPPAIRKIIFVTEMHV